MEKYETANAAESTEPPERLHTRRRRSGLVATIGVTSRAGSGAVWKLIATRSPLWMVGATTVSVEHSPASRFGGSETAVPEPPARSARVTWPSWIFAEVTALPARI